MNRNRHVARAAVMCRLSLVLCAVGGSLVIPQAAPIAQDNAVLVLPKREEELAGKRIGWRFDDVAGALTQADADGKPLVIVFIAENCSWCRIFLAHVLRCDGFNSLAGQAHFVILTKAAGIGPDYEDQKQLGRLLKVQGFPTTAVVGVKAGTISPVAKYAGSVSEASLLESLSKAGLKAPSGNGTVTQQAAVGLPKPAACGTISPEAALEALSPRHVQRGLSP